MKRIFSIVLTLFLFSTMLAIPVSAESVVSFTYENKVTEKDANYTFSYDESRFSSGVYYNHTIAKMSLCLAMAAAKETSANITELLHLLGFSYTDTSIHYPTPAFDYATNTTTIGYAIGSKAAKDSLGDYTLIAVAVRGGGYGNEWGSNFEMGPGSRHAGFEKSAKQVTDGIFDYMENNVSGRVKIWITGFSRGAAVANAAAHTLNKFLPHKVMFATQKDIFAYTFESPYTYTTLAEDLEVFEDDRNIFNIINPTDIVTQIPPVEWGYKRYGYDIYLPEEASTLDTDFDKLKTAEVKELTNIFTAANIENPETEAETYSSTIENQGSANAKFVSDLAATFESHENYAENCEQQMCELIISAFGENGSLLNLLLNNPFPDSTEVILGYAANLFTALNAHYPELELAWMNTTDEYSLTIPTLPTYNPAPVGDTHQDGVIDLKDVLALRIYIADTEKDPYLGNHDIYFDDVIDLKDVLHLRKYVAGNITFFLES